MTYGGIDVGGTKIEARLFNENFETVELRRIPTPKETLSGFIDALSQQVQWLEKLSGQGCSLPVGIAIPGLIDAETRRAFTSNLPASGHDIPALLSQAIGRELPIMNDCQAFALSEANGGAGDGFNTVVGLIMGTGVGAGLTSSGALTRRRNGSALEIGHLGVPARLVQTLGLPLFSCGCGKIGCFEAYASGNGLAALGRFHTGHQVKAEEIVAEAAAGHAESLAILSEWAEVVAELLLLIQLAHDPDCIVLGGGLSSIPDVISLVETPFKSIRLGEMRLPVIRVAVNGDSSGARGAAIMATRIEISATGDL